MSPVETIMRPIEQHISKLFVPESSAKWRAGVCQPSCDPASDIQRPAVHEHPLAAACKGGDVEQLRTLLDGATDAVVAPWSEHAKSPTPLVIAVLRDHRACAELLIASRPRRDLNASCGSDLRTALHVCCALGNVEITKTLVAKRVFLCKPDAHGRSPLFIACMADQPECASVLLAAGVNVEQPMYQNITPLYVASAKGALRCVSLLCEAGARVNAPVGQRDGGGGWGWTRPLTPMLAASQEGHLEVVMLLSSYGAGRSWHKDDAAAEGALAYGSTGMSLEAERLARDAGHTELPKWMRQSYRYSALHHVEVLTPHRAVALLRAGCSPHARPVPLCGAEPGAEKSPAELAREHAPHAPTAKIILRAAEPWSTRTHELWGHHQRRRAVELCKLGYQLASIVAPDRHGAFLDVWLDRVMPLAIFWSSCQAVLPAHKNPDCPGSCPSCPQIRPYPEGRCFAILRGHH